MSANQPAPRWAGQFMTDSMMLDRSAGAYINPMVFDGDVSDKILIDCWLNSSFMYKIDLNWNYLESNGTHDSSSLTRELRNIIREAH